MLGHLGGFGARALLALVVLVVLAVRLLHVDEELARIEVGGNLLKGPLTGRGRNLFPSPQ